MQKKLPEHVVEALLKFEPNYTFTQQIIQALSRIDYCRGRAIQAIVVPEVLASLRQTARLKSTHFSTFIEGNRLSLEQISSLLEHAGRFPGREREEDEVRGYYAALAQVERWAEKGMTVSEKLIQQIHALVMAAGKKTLVKATPYREAQNVIYDNKSRAIVYMPPEAKDMAGLMAGLVQWINENQELPCPIVAALAHYQFVTIHPYYDGNGRTARLLATFIIHRGEYDLQGIYSLEEYYAQNLSDYYDALTVGRSHNYYLGRAEADLTQWITYFVTGMADAFEKVVGHLLSIQQDEESIKKFELLGLLKPDQKKVLELFAGRPVVSSQEIAQFFGFSSRSAAALCAKWVTEGFLVFADPSKRARRYQLAECYESLRRAR